MNIGDAVAKLKDKRCMARQAWPDITYVYLFGEVIMYSHMGIESVWGPSHLDLLNDDWIEVIPGR